MACSNKEVLPLAQLRYAETTLPTSFGNFRCIVYRLPDGLEHLALIKGDVENKTAVHLRLQSECLTSEVFGSLKCDCKAQLDKAMTHIQENGGVLLYLRQEGRGIGLGNKIRAYQLQETGADTVDANRMLGFPDDGRNFYCAVRILRDLNINSVKLLTNNPSKVESLVNAGIHVVERIPHNVEFSAVALQYMKTKSARMGHILDHGFEAEPEAMQLWCGNDLVY
jgi:GTP cyclohydrolase II